MAASMLSPPPLPSPLGARHALAMPTSPSFRTDEIRKRERRTYCSHRAIHLHSDHGHSVSKRENFRSSVLDRREPENNGNTFPVAAPVPSGCVDSTIRRSLPSSPAHHGVNEHTHSANDCGNLQATGAQRKRSKPGRQTRAASNKPAANKPASPTVTTAPRRRQSSPQRRQSSPQPRPSPQPRRRPSSPHPAKHKREALQRVAVANANAKENERVENERLENERLANERAGTGKAVASSGASANGKSSACGNGETVEGGGAAYSVSQRRTSSAFDSGRGDELSSSCESDSQTKYNGGHQSLRLQCMGERGGGGGGSRPVYVSSDSSDVDDEVFQDALSSLPDSDSSTATSAFMTPRSQSPLHSPPPGAAGTATEDPSSSQFAQSLTKSLEQVAIAEVDRSELSDRSNEASSGVGASVDTNDDPLNQTLTSSSSWVGLAEATPTSVVAASQESTGSSSSVVSKGKSKGRTRKKSNGLPVQEGVQDSTTSSPLTSMDSSANGKQRKGSPKGKKKKKVPLVETATILGGASLQPQLGPRQKSNVKAPKPDQLQSSSSVSSASPLSSVCSHSPLTLSPSPTSSFNGQLAVAQSVEMSINPSLTKLFAHSNLTGGQSAANGGAAAPRMDDVKDEWPDLGMDYNAPPPRKPKIHRHLEVEAKAIASPERRVEEQDSGSSSMSLGSASELVTAGLIGNVAIKQTKLLPLESPPLLTPVTSPAAYIAVNNIPPPFVGGGGAGLLQAPQFVGDALLPPPLHPPHPSQHQMTSQQYLWLQSQHLNVFVQQHQEQQLKHTSNHIFYPVDPIGHVPPEMLRQAPMAHYIQPAPPHLQPTLQHTLQPPLLHLPPHPHQPPSHLPLPHPPPPRPLFFPPVKPQVGLQQGTDSSPPTPPPPPPLPVRPYLLAAPPTKEKSTYTALPIPAAAAAAAAAMAATGGGGGSRTHYKKPRPGQEFRRSTAGDPKMSRMDSEPKRKPAASRDPPPPRTFRTDPEPKRKPVADLQPKKKPAADFQSPMAADLEPKRKPAAPEPEKKPTPSQSPQSDHQPKQPAADPEPKKSPAASFEPQKDPVVNLEPKKKSAMESETKKKPAVESETKKKHAVESETKKKHAVESETKKKCAVESEAKVKPAVESETKKKPAVESETKKKCAVESEAKVKPTADSELKKSPAADSKVKKPSASPGLKKQPVSPKRAVVDSKPKTASVAASVPKAAAEFEPKMKRAPDQEPKKLLLPAEPVVKEKAALDSPKKLLLPAEPVVKEKAVLDPHVKKKPSFDHEPKKKPPDPPDTGPPDIGPSGTGPSGTGPPGTGPLGTASGEATADPDSDSEPRSKLDYPQATPKSDNEEVELELDSCGMERQSHLLEDTWVLWFDKITGTHRSSCANYQASLKELTTVTSIEGFWRLHNNLKTPCHMENNSNFHFFKSGINPLWEDVENKNGGKWVFTVRNDLEALSKSWLEVLLLLIGSTSDQRDQINGAVVSRRKKGDRISLWTATREEAPNLDICAYFIRCLLYAYNVPVDKARGFVKQLADNRNGLSLVFMHHCDSLKTGHSYQNDARITLNEHIDVILQKIEKL